MMDSFKQKWYDTMIMRGHTPRMDGEDLDILWPDDDSIHSGPSCTVCGWSICMWCHCEDTDPHEKVPMECIPIPVIVPYRQQIEELRVKLVEESQSYPQSFRDGLERAFFDVLKIIK